MQRKTSSDRCADPRSRIGDHASGLRRGTRWSLPFGRAFEDLWQGWRYHRDLWLTLGWYDIRKRYRRSLLGPLWITIGMGAFVAALSLLYGPLMGGHIADYLPFVAVGFIAWQLISELVNEGCNVFIVNGPIIEQLKAPLSIYIFQMIYKNLIIFAHNILIYLIIILFFAVSLSWSTLLVIPGIALICLNGVSVGMLLGTASARFRDIPPIVASIMQMMFFLTPILWLPDRMPGREAFIALNPFYYFVEIIRQPLLGRRALRLGMDGGAGDHPRWSFGFDPLLSRRFHNRIVYWL